MTHDNTQAATHSKDVPHQEASIDIWSSKYQLKDANNKPVDRSIEDTNKRVAQALADVEGDFHNADSKAVSDFYNQFLWAMNHGAVPAGRILSNAGSQDYKPETSTINCTVSGTIFDSMDNILTRNHEAGLTLKKGSGIGYEFSTLRPKGAFVAGAGASTSGPLSFMDIYDRMCKTVSSAGGRRGAQMATFDIHHPDVVEFISAKREDGRLRQFNLSLLITSDFIEAVQADDKWRLSFPTNEKEVEALGLDLNDPAQVIYRAFPSDDESYYTNSEGDVACRVYQEIPARTIWNLIMESTYDYAEPGFILIDEVNRMNNNWFCEHIRASNPCVTGDTWVQTSSGPMQVSDLIGSSFKARVDGVDYDTGIDGFFKTADKQVCEIQTDRGQRIRLTHDHKVLRRSGGESEWVEADSLEINDDIVLHNHRSNAVWSGRGSEAEGYLIGMLLGDGTISETMGAILSVWGGAEAVNGDSDHSSLMAAVSRYAEKALSLGPTSKGWHQVKGRNEHRLHSVDLASIAGEFGMSAGDKLCDNRIEKTSSEFHAAFLRGLFDADGSVQGSQDKGVSIRLAQSDMKTLERVQRMLLRFGIVSKIYANRRSSGHRSMPDGKGGSGVYAFRDQHELVVSGESIAIFNNLVGFEDSDKSQKLNNAISSYQRSMNADSFTTRVESITDAGVEPVYDVQVPGPNAFDANGLYVHNCGEQMLPPYGSCLLGSIDLTKFVIDPFTKDARFDWELYSDVIRIFTRMLDNVVEINNLPLEQQRDEILSKRRHGMGIMGLGSALTMLRMAYGDKDSVSFTEKVSEFLAVEGWREGLALAREKGPAPVLEQDYEITPKIMSLRPELARDGYAIGDRVAGKVLHSKYSQYMQRIAKVDPELVDQLAEEGARFTHHTSIAPTGTIALSIGNNASNGIEPSFSHHYARNIIREGRNTKEKVDVFSFELLAYRHLVNEDAMPFSEHPKSQIPSYFSVTDDVTPKQHVDIQAAAQKWVDSSISKTANVPQDFPYEDFKDIYLYAYKKGLKGCTTFRFNPEAFQGVLVKDEDLKNTNYEFVLESGEKVVARGDQVIHYNGEEVTAANLFDALKEGTYGTY